MANIKSEQVIMVIGSLGSDAGYTVLTPHGLVHVPGNNPEVHAAFDALSKSFAKIQAIAQKAQ